MTQFTEEAQARVKLDTEMSKCMQKSFELLSWSLGFLLKPVWAQNDSPLASPQSCMVSR